MESLQQKMIWSLRNLDSLAIKDRREQDYSLYIFKISDVISNNCFAFLTIHFPSLFIFFRPVIVF